jgi:hypothetical protein
MPSTTAKHKPVAFTATRMREQTRSIEDATALQLRAGSKGDRANDDLV